MKLFGRKKEPEKQRSIAIMGGGSWETLACSGYTSLDQNPEVVTAVETIAGLVGLMTLQLMENEENGDVRVRNALSNVLDVKPNKYMGRSNFIQWIVRTMFLEGGGNAVVLPVTSNGTLQSLQPIPPAMVAFEPVGLFDYKVVINGKPYNPQNVLHFVLNPDTYSQQERRYAYNRGNRLFIERNKIGQRKVRECKRSYLFNFKLLRRNHPRFARFGRFNVFI